MFLTVSLGVEFQGLHDRGLRFVNTICHRVGRPENCVRGKGPKPRVDSAVAYAKNWNWPPEFPSLS